jgi:hypothetical protein
MQTLERETEPGNFEVILYFEGNSWLFSTFARGSLMLEVLDQAEKEFSVHLAVHHELGNNKFKVTSAYLIHDRYDFYFAKRNGKWQLAHPSMEHPAFARRQGQLHAAPSTGKQFLESGCVMPLSANV